MKFSELIGHSITCIKTFNPVVTTIDSHADEFIARVSESLPTYRFTSNLLSIGH